MAGALWLLVILLCSGYCENILNSTRYSWIRRPGKADSILIFNGSKLRSPAKQQHDYVIKHGINEAEEVCISTT